MNSSEISKPIKLIVWILIAFTGCYTFWQLTQTVHYTKDSISDLTRAFDNVIHPEGAKFHGDKHIVSQTTIQAVYTDIVVPAYTNQILSFYQNSLLQAGWKQVELGIENLGNKKLKFCLDDMNLDIEVIEDVRISNVTRYYFGIHRQNAPNIKTGCH